ncbi:rod shape-determining protein MreC [Myxacorys almedinensis]|uniref:Cell shape-determining protein MreC n=1 Tax=Myxacorys almedinensis A TaxID=2690445 RepID=A0A8J7Z1V6_9CYAN|nr:rod shape-determining protein MreC [Myxacorys almedinensis]NDJ18114.1 rod shape-determining protein MreC [Myxacorys almedinensis A]
MFALRRWWDRYGIQITLTSLAVGTALLIRQTQGGVLLETYQWLTRPFQSKPNPQAQVANAQMLELQQRLIELESKNQRLEELLGFVQVKKGKGITAPVIGRSADHWWQQLSLGRGRRDGVEKESVVLSPGGVVGRVTAVTAHTSRVLLLSDPTSRVGVTISRSRTMGSMRGNSGNRGILEFYEKNPDVRRGDVVTSSALSGRFPSGLPIGRIESVDTTKSPAPEAIVELSAPVSYLEWAVIYPKSPEVAEPLAPASGSAPSPVPSPNVLDESSPSTP